MVLESLAVPARLFYLRQEKLGLNDFVPLFQRVPTFTVGESSAELDG